MDLTQLRHLVALAEHGSFTRAAQHSHLTQPALSRSIAQLESEVGGPLVDRIGRRNEITPFGRMVLEHARHVLFEADELMRSVKLQASGGGGQIRLGLGSTPSELLAVPLLCHMARHRPAPRLILSRGVAPRQIQALRERALDAVVVEMAGIVPGPDLHIEDVAALRTGALCRRGHPLARRKRLGLDELRRWPLACTFVPEEKARSMVSTYGPDAHPSELLSFVSEDIAPMLEAVAATDMIYLGVLAPARRRIEQGVLVELPLLPLHEETHFALVRLAGRSPPPALGLVRTIVLEVMARAAAGTAVAAARHGSRQAPPTRSERRENTRA